MELRSGRTYSRTMVYRDASAPHPLVYVSDSTAVALDRETGRPMWTYRAQRRLARLLLAYGNVYLLDTGCIVQGVTFTDGTRL